MSRLLVIDDSRFMIKMIEDRIKTLFPTTPIEIIGIIDPELAFDTLMANKIDAVIADYNMPKINGIDLINKLKKTSPDIHFLLLSASTKFTNSHSIPESFLFAKKPITDKELSDFINLFINQA